MAYVLMELLSLKSTEWVVRLGTRNRRNLRSSPKGVNWQSSLVLRGGLSLVLVSPSTDWMRPNNIMKCNLLYLKSTNLNVHLMQTQPQRNVQDSVWWHMLAYWPSQADTQPPYWVRKYSPLLVKEEYSSQRATASSFWNSWRALVFYWQTRILTFY